MRTPERSRLSAETESLHNLLFSCAPSQHRLRVPPLMIRLTTSTFPHGQEDLEYMKATTKPLIHEMVQVTLAMELEDILVKDEYRANAKELEKVLFQELAKIAKEKVCFAIPCLLESYVSPRLIELCILDWTGLDVSYHPLLSAWSLNDSASQWSALTLKFYNKIGAQAAKDDIYLRLDEEGIEKLYGGGSKQ
ncbi:hypothetical protein ACEPAI_10015 [Sanghuangporus weigelae]